MASSLPTSQTKETPDTGLRGRKKAKRRQQILRVAGALFEANGFDSTTMAEIAEAADISSPTVFNYFGSKENILSALLFEGTERERSQHLAQPRRIGAPFSEILGDLMCEITENTLRIAGKRVWRYAESTNIRRTKTEFQRQFTESDLELVRLIRAYLGAYDLKLRSKAEPDHEFLALLVFDRWTARYLEFIKDDDMPLKAHMKTLKEDAASLVDLVFEDGFAQCANLKETEYAG